MLETKFKFYIYLLPVLTFAVPIILYSALFLEGGFSSDLPIFLKIYFSSLMVFTFIYLLYGELRTKAIYVRIEKDRVIMKPFLGLGKKKEYQIDFFDGYSLSNLYYLHQGYYEYLYLVKNNKKIIKISAFHHANYFEIKKLIDARMNFNGWIEFSLIDEFKEIFK